MRRICFAIFSLMLVSCGDKTDFDSYGLKKVEIRLSPTQMNDFMRGAPQKIDVPGKAIINEQEYGIRIEAAGKSTIREAKKSFDLRFMDGDPQNGAEEVRFATTIKDRSMLRALLAFEIGNAAGFSMPSIEPVFVYLNDLTLGLYFMIEKIDEYYLNRRNIAWTRLYEAEDNADFASDMPLRIQHAFESRPKPDQIEFLSELVKLTHRTSDEDFTATVFSYVDRTEIVRYFAFTALLNHFDGFKKNYYLVQPSGGSSALRILPWDFDLIWRADAPSGASLSSVNHLFRRIELIPSIQTEVQNRITDLRTRVVNAATLQTRISTWKEKIRRAYDADPILGRQGKSIDAESAELELQIQNIISRYP